MSSNLRYAAAQYYMTPFSLEAPMGGADRATSTLRLIGLSSSPDQHMNCGRPKSSWMRGARRSDPPAALTENERRSVGSLATPAYRIRNAGEEGESVVS
jgi:hypothetical protein